MEENAEEKSKNLDSYFKTYGNLDDYNRYSFKDDNFEIFYSPENVVVGLRTYSGKYTKDSENKLTLDYQKVILEIPEDDIRVTQGGLEPITEILIDGDYGDNKYSVQNANKDVLKEFNENNIFIAENYSTWQLDTKYQNFIFPQFEFINSQDASRNERVINTDKILSGKFICTENYGVELDGKYSNGKYSNGNAFKFNYNPINTFLQSPNRESEGTSEKLAHICRFLEVNPDDVYDTKEIVTDSEGEYLKTTYLKNGKEVTSYDYNTTISFKDGEWRWENQEGMELLRGGYNESNDYPGLILMYATEGEAYKLFVNAARLLVYISENGEILTPHYIAM
jgi:hypothetical protein